MLSKTRSDKIFNIGFFILFSTLALFIPLSKPVVVYIITFILFFWLLEKPWYLIPAAIYVAIVWHTKSAIYIATGIIILIGIIDVILWLTKQYRLSLFYDFRREPFRRYILSFSIIYLLYIIGLIYSKNMDYAAFDLEVKFSLFIFPAVISTLRKEVFSNNKFIWYLVFFVTGLIISIIISFGDAFINYLHNFSFKEFYYTRLSFYHHPGYLSMYMNLGVVILIYFLSGKDENRLNIWHVISFIFLIIIFSIFIILLSSKAGIVCLLVVYLVTIGYMIVYEKKIYQGIAYILLVALMFYFSLLIFPTSLNRIIEYREVVDNKITMNEADNETGDRITIWRNSTDVIKKHFLFGVGTGDVKDNLLEEYKQSESTEALEKRLNAHNQFLQTFITLGIVGFLVLILSVVLPAYYALKHHCSLYIIFLTIIVINFLVESMLETQAGVVFYAFFNAIFFYFAKINDHSDHQLIQSKT